MAIAAPSEHASVYLLGDHLDAALAMGEDMLTERLALLDPLTAPGHRAVQEFLAGVRCLELAMTARLLEARKRADTLKRCESRLRPLLALFLAGTQPLVDAAAALGDNSVRDFDTGATVSAFLRGRGLIAPDAAGLERLESLAVTEGYLVAGTIPLGALLDLIATTLDTLDSLFDLFPEEAAGAHGRAPGAIAPFAGEPHGGG